MIKISCLDLYKKQYTLDVLAHNINNLQIKIILHTQKLDAEFCAKYILDDYYCSCSEDEDLINYGYVLRHQPHITATELDVALLLQIID